MKVVSHKEQRLPKWLSKSYAAWVYKRSNLRKWAVFQLLLLIYVFVALDIVSQPLLSKTVFKYKGKKY